jgi:glutamate-1-semialdehyde 2,1-aminomutase
MFCLFFTPADVKNLADATTASFETWRRYFLSMLEQGVYTAPSPFETGFISTAHTEADIDATVAAMHNALKAL